MGKLRGLARAAAAGYTVAIAVPACGVIADRAGHRRPHAGMPRMAARWVNVEAIGSYFQSLSDPRHARNRKHLLVDAVVIAVCGMVCGCDGPTAIHRWAAQRHDWLKQFLALPNGVPSRDRVRRLLMALSPEAFQGCFRDWIAQAIRTEE